MAQRPASFGFPVDIFPGVMSAVQDKGRIIFYEEEGSKDFMGGTFFPEPKKGGSRFFFQSLILNVFLKKVCNIRN